MANISESLRIIAAEFSCACLDADGMPDHYVISKDAFDQIWSAIQVLRKSCRANEYVTVNGTFTVVNGGKR